MLCMLWASIVWRITKSWAVLTRRTQLSGQRFWLQRHDHCNEVDGRWTWQRCGSLRPWMQSSTKRSSADEPFHCLEKSWEWTFHSHAFVQHCNRNVAFAVFRNQRKSTVLPDKTIRSLLDVDIIDEPAIQVRVGSPVVCLFQVVDALSNGIVWVLCRELAGLEEHS